MKKLMLVAAVAVTMLGFTGCKSGASQQFESKTGEYVGMVIHTVYENIADKQPAEFSQYVESLWNEIDKIESPDQIEGVYGKISELFDKIIESKNLNAKQLALIKAVRTAVDKALIKAIKKEAKKHEKAVAWLMSVREGIRIMREVNTADDAKLEELEKRLAVAFSQPVE